MMLIEYSFLEDTSSVVDGAAEVGPPKFQTQVKHSAASLANTDSVENGYAFNTTAKQLKLSDLMRKKVGKDRVSKSLT